MPRIKTLVAEKNARGVHAHSLKETSATLGPKPAGVVANSTGAEDDSEVISLGSEDDVGCTTLDASDSASSRLSWQDFPGTDVDQVVDVDVVNVGADGDLELCKQLCEHKGYGGFVVAEGRAHLKAACAEELKVRLVRGHNSTHIGFYKEERSIAHGNRVSSLPSPSAKIVEEVSDCVLRPLRLLQPAAVSSGSVPNPQRCAPWQAESYRDADGKPEAEQSIGVWLDASDFVLGFGGGNIIGVQSVGDVGTHCFPRDWPRVYKESAALKGLLKKSGPCEAHRAPKKIGLPDKRMQRCVIGLPLLPLQCFENAMAVSDHCGFGIVKGWAIYDVTTMNPGDAYLLARHWWNCDERGEWVDFTPHPSSSHVLLVEATAPSACLPSVLTYEQVMLADDLVRIRFDSATSVMRAGLGVGSTAERSPALVATAALYGMETKRSSRLQNAMSLAGLSGPLGPLLTDSMHDVPTVLLLAVLIRSIQTGRHHDESFELFTTSDGVDTLMDLVNENSTHIAAAAATALACLCNCDAIARQHMLHLGAASVLTSLFARADITAASCSVGQVALVVWRMVEPFEDTSAVVAERPAAWDFTRGQHLFRLCTDALQPQHADLPAQERRVRSWARTVAFARVALGARGALAREGDVLRPFVIWVIGAKDIVEAQLAEDGHFNDVNFVDQAPTEVLLIGRGLRALRLGAKPQEAAGGPTLSIRTVSSEEMLVLSRLSAPVPDLIVAFMPDASEFGDNSSPTSAFFDLPEPLVAAVEQVPIAITTRYSLSESSAMSLRCKLRDQILLPLTRSPFSAKAGRSQASFDENGWVFVICGGPSAMTKAMRLDMSLQRGPPPGATRIPALFWGILDIKYDVARPVLDRIKILETGNGRTSKFSGHGAEILKCFREKYTLEEDASDFHVHRVVSADKKLTHDMFERSGFGHLTPKQVCMPRRYHRNLANNIVSALGVNDSDLVILKLCNRSRAAGVLVVPALELDQVLQDLLHPPPDMAQWCDCHLKRMSCGTPVDFGIKGNMLEEQRRHWWSNESPVFLAEQCCRSVPIVIDGLSYDGTLRVAFALRRRESSGATGIPSRLEPDSLEVDWLGGYWKLPKDDASTGSLRDMVVSAARTSGTAPVQLAHLLEVYAAVDDAVLELFSSTEPSPVELETTYQEQPELAAYLMARFGTARMAKRPGRFQDMLDTAEQVLCKATDVANIASVKSFIERARGVFEARQVSSDRWRRAEVLFNVSLWHLPANANTLYLLGMAALQSDKQGCDFKAVELLSKSLLFDPDFRAGYVNLAIGYLRVGEFANAIEVSEAGLERHPHAPQPHYHIGIASCMLANNFRTNGGLVEEMNLDCFINYEHYRAQALASLSKARATDEAKKRSRARLDGGLLSEAPWLEVDDQMHMAMEVGTAQAYQHIELPRSVGWAWINFRM